MATEDCGSGGERTQVESIGSIEDVEQPAGQDEGSLAHCNRQ